MVGHPISDVDHLPNNYQVHTSRRTTRSRSIRRIIKRKVRLEGCISLGMDIDIENQPHAQNFYLLHTTGRNIVFRT